MPNEIYPGIDFMMEEHDIQKLGWRRGEVATMLNTTNTNVQYYTKLLGLEVRHADHKFTIYRKDQIDLLKLFIQLMDIGFSAKGAADNIHRADKILNAIQ